MKGRLMVLLTVSDVVPRPLVVLEEGVPFDFVDPVAAESHLPWDRERGGMSVTYCQHTHTHTRKKKRVQPLKQRRDS